MSNGSAAQFPTFKEWAEDAAPEAPHLMRVSHATRQATAREDIPPNVMDIIHRHARDTLNEFTRGINDANVSPTWFQHWTYNTSWKFDTYDTDEAREIIVWGYTSDTDHTEHIYDLDGGSVWHVIECELYEVINRYAREALLSLTKDYAEAREGWEAQQED